MAETVYGFDDSKSKVQVVDKATQDATDASQDGRLTALESKNTEQDGRLTALEEGAIELVAGTGIAIGDDGQTINHKNSVSAQTSYIGSATSVPRLKFDAQGHITGVSTATIYPPTTPGTSGQVWVSDGNGAGSWQTPVSGKKELYTGTLASLITINSSKQITINKEFDIEYIWVYGTGNSILTSRQTISPGVYSGKMYMQIGLSPISYGNNACIRLINSSLNVAVTTDDGSVSQVDILNASTSTTISASCYRLYV